MRDGQQFEKLRIVVEHFLKVRNEPALVDRIAGKAAAEMIVNAALANMMQRNVDGAEITRLAGAQTCPPQQLEQSGLRKFRRAARAAIHRIDNAAELLRGVVEFGDADRDRAGFARGAGETLHQSRAVLLDLLRLFAKQSRDLAQHVDESRLAVTRRTRKVSAAPDRLAVRREKHGQRPAALLAEMMQRRHVNLIDVGTLLAIDLDVDEQLVHHAGGIVVLETLVRHHVAPVAGGVADGKQDRPSCLLRRCQRLRTPRPPIDRVVHVLEEVRAGFVPEPVFRAVLVL